eukprot:gene5076-910_t
MRKDQGALPDLHVLWIKAHVKLPCGGKGLDGNDQAERLAKLGTTLPIRQVAGKLDTVVAMARHLKASGVRGDTPQTQQNFDRYPAGGGASDVVEALQGRVDTLALSVHHHGAPVKPPTLADPSPHGVHAAALLRRPLPVCSRAACSPVARASTFGMPAERDNCKRETLRAVLADFDACADI